eukprot:11467110-Alexandrium_andersonii.AAC.1
MRQLAGQFGRRMTRQLRARNSDAEVRAQGPMPASPAHSGLVGRSRDPAHRLLRPNCALGAA